MRGGWLDMSHGARHYGEQADFAQAIFTHNTPVPACNRPLNNAHNIDMTESFNNDTEFSYYQGPLSHFYPVSKYEETFSSEGMRPMGRTFSEFPKGEVEYL